jgi:hypothetical protein
MFFCKCVNSDPEDERFRFRPFLRRRDPEDFKDATDDATSSTGQSQVSGGLHESERRFMVFIDHSVVRVPISLWESDILCGVALCDGGIGKS